MRHWTFVLSLCALVGSPRLPAATLVVDLNGGGDYTDIDPAIDAAQDGETVLVRAGEYLIVEPVSFLGKAITVRSELGPEVTTIRMSETPSDPKRASVVIFKRGEMPTSRLEGFTLTGGRVSFHGGSSPILASCAISGSPRGGVYCWDDSSPVLTDCAIAGNSGNGVSCRDDSFPVLTNCTIAANSGQGVYCEYGSSPTLTDSTISGNADSGLFCYDFSSPTLTNV